LGIAPLVARHYRYQFLFSFLIWTLALAIFILCGSFLPVSRFTDTLQLNYFKPKDRLNSFKTCRVLKVVYVFIPKLDLTLDVVVLFVLAVVSIIGAIYFVMLYIVANVPYSFIIARAFIVISILMVGTRVTYVDPL